MLKYIDVEFPLTDTPPQRVSACNWSQRRYEHDMGKIRFADWSPDVSALLPGSPMKITFSLGEKKKTHYAYIHHVTHHRTADKNYVDVHIIGASYVMSQTAQTVYTHVTASAVAQQIAKAHKFSYDVDSHPRVYQQISNPGRSEWELLVDLAKKSGYTLRSEAATLVFKSLVEDYLRQLPDAQEFFVTTPGSPVRPTLYSIRPLVGESLEYDDAKKASVAVSGQDPNSKNYFTVTNLKQAEATRERVNPEFFDRYDVKTTVDSYTAAVHEAKAAQENNRFPYRAHAVLVGTPDLRPDMPIKLSGVNEDLDGYWVVIEANHIVEDGMYTTEVEIGLDSLGIPLVKREIANKLNVLVPPPALTVSHNSVKPLKTTRFAKVANRLSGNPTGAVSALWTGSSTNLRLPSSSTSKARQVLSL